MADLVPYQPAPVGPPGYPPRFSNPEGYPEVRDTELGISDYFAVLRRQKWIVLGAIALCVGVALWLVLSAPPRYTANAVVRLADARRAMTGGEEGGAYEQVLGRETDVLLSQIQVMMSRQVAAEVVRREGLRFVPYSDQPTVDEMARAIVDSSASQDTVRLDFNAGDYSLTEGGQVARAAYGQPASLNGVTVTVNRRPSIPTALYQVVSTGKAIDAMRGSFKATPRPKTDVIDVQFTSTSPRYAQRVVNSIVQAFQEHNALGAQKASRTRRIFLEEQLKQTDAMLQRAMNQYSDYRSGNQVFSSKEKASAQQAGIVDVDMRRADLNAQRRTYNSLLSQAQRGAEGSDAGLKALVSSPGIAANPVIQQLYSQLTSFEARRDSLISNGAAGTNPDVVRATTLVSQTSGRLMAAVRNQIQALDAQIDALDDLKAKSTAEIAGAPKAETEEARLGEQVAAVQRMSDKLQEEYQGARMAEAVEAGQVEIIDLADIPTDPISAGRTKKLALGLIIGLIIGIGSAIVVDGMNTSIRRRDDIEKILQVPGLAVIPKFAGDNGHAATRLLPKKASTRNGKGAARAAGLVTVHDARSSGAEAYRTLRTNLIFSQAVQTLRSIVVTSAAPGEGKTTTAANLAVSFAQQGMRVLIIDCDLRRSRLHKMFSVAREPGITECVLGQIDTDTAPRETGVTGLYVLPSGQLPPNPSELLGGERMRKTLTAFSEAFDLIVLDTPPLLAASDAAILSTLADGVVLVVRAGVTEAEAGQQAMQQLMSVGARVVGAVLNDPDAKVQKYGGYYSYDYAKES
ncbi:MAG TPA: polysaccharide biosynthesis tyrosine autokinase [Gemmatimonadaceae bacterium]|nr:polysaccharide biosynthesis tyrosine autokinase [Gemmatimonadaceae bacterium]